MDSPNKLISCNFFLFHLQSGIFFSPHESYKKIDWYSHFRVLF